MPDAGNSNTDAGAGDGGDVSDGGEIDAGFHSKCTNPDDYTTCVCDVKSDCTPNDPSKAKFFVCTPRKICVRICLAAADCATGEVCEDSTCKPTACGVDAECAAGQACIDSLCAPAIAASSVAACQVLSPMVLRAGATKPVTLLTRDAKGQAIPYKGAVTWSTSSGTIASVAGTDIVANVTGGTSAGTAAIGASIGELACSPILVSNFAAPASSDVRVVVVEERTGKLLSGATVVVNGSTTAITDVSGTVVFSNPSQPATISVFDQNHAYVTLVDVSSKDILVSTPLNPTVIKLTGSMTPRNFDNLPDRKGTTHAAFVGAAVEGSWLDFRAGAALGDPVLTTIDLGGSTKTDVDVPAGEVLGLAENMFKSNYEVRVPGPGLHTLWGVGGNMVLSDVLGVVSQATGGGDIDFGAVNAALAPVTGRLNTGVMRIDVPSVGQNTIDMKLTVGKRLQMAVTVPVLPTYQDANETLAMDQAGIFAGALDQWQGLVVLGSGSGFDRDLDNRVDASGVQGQAGVVPVRLSGLHSGLETSNYGVVAIASRTDMSPQPSSGGDVRRMALSMLIARPALLTNPQTNPNNVSFGRDFLQVPGDATLDEGTRTLTMPPSNDATFHRLDVGDTNESKWYVYLPGTATSFQFPAAPSGFADRFTGAQPPAMYVHNVGASLTLDEIAGFDGQDMDRLNDVMNALSTREIMRSSGPTP